jgi:hypothetical protein
MNAVVFKNVYVASIMLRRCTSKCSPEGRTVQNSGVLQYTKLSYNVFLRAPLPLCLYYAMSTAETCRLDQTLLSLHSGLGSGAGGLYVARPSRAVLKRACLAARDVFSLDFLAFFCAELSMFGMGGRKMP